MAPLKPVKKDAPDQRVQAIIEKAKDLCALLKDRESISLEKQTEVEKLVKTFPNPTKNASSGILTDLETCGSEIWNASTSLIRSVQASAQDQQESTHTGCLLRTFAFFLLDLAYQSSPKRQKDQHRLVRNLKVGVKACKVCLEAGELSLASNAIQRCGQYVAAVSEDSPLVKLTSNGDGGDVRASLEEPIAQLRLLRMVHAWRTERLDLAEHFYLEFSSSSAKQPISLTEDAADFLHEIGKGLLSRKLLVPAEKWLQRALASLSSCDVTQLSPDGLEMRLAISASLVNCFVADGSQHALQRAQSLIEELEASHGLGNRIAVQLLRLKVTLTGERIDEDELSHVMARIIRSSVLSEHSFKMIMKAINRVNTSSHSVACRSLGDLITSRLLPDVILDGELNQQVMAWIESVCVTYALFVTKDSERAHHATIDWLQQTYDSTSQAVEDMFSSKATHAIQALVYKASATKDANLSKKWLQILRHRLFDTAGQVNKAKIGRKAIHAAMTNGDLEAAGEAFYQMSETAQNESRTRYLAFKLALQSNNYQLAMDSLNIVVKKAEHDPSSLYGCVLDAQQSDMRHLAVAALLAIIDNMPAQVHYAALLRCAARLLIGELENRERSLDEVMDQTLRVFENASRNTQALLGSSGDRSRIELQWWTKNAYNTALRYCTQVHPEHLVRMLRVCTQLMAMYPRDDGPMHIDDLQHRLMLCHFLAATALIVLARSHPEDSEERLQSYLEARGEIATFTSACQQLVQVDDTEKVKTFRRMLEMLKFNLECVINLRQWGQLDETLQACLKLDGIDRWDTLADLALSIQRKLSTIEVDDSTHKRLTELLQRVINDTWKREKDMVKAGRWLRISYSHDLKHGSGDFAFSLLAQAAGMAKKGYDGKTDPFPEMELQWLATTAFNKAIDLLGQAKHDGCKKWLDGALELARYSEDNGALHANLTDKRNLIDERMKSGAQT